MVKLSLLYEAGNGDKERKITAPKPDA